MTFIFDWCVLKKITKRTISFSENVLRTVQFLFLDEKFNKVTKIHSHKNSYNRIDTLERNRNFWETSNNSHLYNTIISLMFRKDHQRCMLIIFPKFFSVHAVSTIPYFRNISRDFAKVTLFRLSRPFYIAYLLAITILMSQWDKYLMCLISDFFSFLSTLSINYIQNHNFLNKTKNIINAYKISLQHL